jgi:hypothetical protein
MRVSSQLAACAAVALAAALAAGCGDLGDDSQNENEVITTVALKLAPMGGGAAIDAAFDDADGDGGEPPKIDPIDLTAGTTYTLTVRFLNKLEDPPEEITDEVADEGDEHQVFFTGSAVSGPTGSPPPPLQHSYGDADRLGLPVGLVNTVVASAGTGTLTVTLRHLPPIDGVAVKTADVAERVKTGGIGAIGGETDAEVRFAVTVR